MNTRHQRTLDAVFVTPTRANIEWSAIEALFLALGAEIEERAGSRIGVSLNGTDSVFHRPHPGREATKPLVRRARTFLIRGNRTMMKIGRYLAEIEYDPDEDSFYGRSVNIRNALFDFWGSSIEELRREGEKSARELEQFSAERGRALDIVPVSPALSRAARDLGRRKSPVKAATARDNGRKGGRPARDPRELLASLIADERYREHGVEEIDGRSVHWIKYSDRARVYGNTEEEMVRKAFRLYKPGNRESSPLQRSA